jgi:hypothetical protein
MTLEMTSTDISTEELITANLMFPQVVTMPLLEQHGCTIEKRVLQEPLPYAGLRPGDTTYWVVFPSGTKREKRSFSLPHAHRYLLTLPDGSMFDELYHLSFHQSIISQPFSPPAYH